MKKYVIIFVCFVLFFLNLNKSLANENIYGGNFENRYLLQDKYKKTDSSGSIGYEKITFCNLNYETETSPTPDLNCYFIDFTQNPIKYKGIKVNNMFLFDIFNNQLSGRGNNRDWVFKISKTRFVTDRI